MNYAKKHKRYGHGQDVLDSNNVRQVAGCLPINFSTRKILLISSRKRENAWVIPRGGWESDKTQKHAAQRETWEEAGVKGTIIRQLGVYRQLHLKARHWVFEMEVKCIKEKFPEHKKRDKRPLQSPVLILTFNKLLSNPL